MRRIITRTVTTVTTTTWTITWTDALTPPALEQRAPDDDAGDQPLRADDEPPDVAPDADEQP